MIQPMNKYAFLIFHREYEAFLGELRSLGVVHVQEQKQAKEVEELQQIIRERAHLSEVLGALRPYATGKAPETTEGTEKTEGKATPISSSPTAPVLRSEEEGRQLIAEVEAQLARLATLQERLKRYLLGGSSLPKGSLGSRRLAIHSASSLYPCRASPRTSVRATTSSR